MPRRQRIPRRLIFVAAAVILLAGAAAVVLLADRFLSPEPVAKAIVLLQVDRDWGSGDRRHPDGNQTQCRDWIRPVRCDSRAVLALDFRVKGFVRCFVQQENSDGSLDAVCYVDRTSFDPGEDLAAYLVERGWALALPYAPFSYHALEKIASKREVGVWGFPADSFSRRVFPEGSGRW